MPRKASLLEDKGIIPRVQASLMLSEPLILQPVKAALGQLGGSTPE